MNSFFRRYSTQLILLSVALAIGGGIYLPQVMAKISFLGTIFINLLKLFALPLICSALITALGSMGDSLGQLKSLARNVVAYMLISEVIAVSIALGLFNIFKPGVGIDPNLILQGQPYTSSGGEGLNLANFLLSIFPHNIFESLAKFDLLPVVIFSIMFGIGCAVAANKSKPIVKLFAATRDVANVCLHGVMFLAPIGIFALVGNGIAESNLNGNLSKDLVALLTFVVILVLGLVLHGLWQFIVVVVLTKQSPLQVLKQSIPVFSDLENDYIRNYERIAKDHIKAYEPGIQNPFIEERLWDAMEDSTLKLIMKYLPNLSKGNEIKILDVGVGMGRLIDKIRSNLSNDMRIAFYGIDIALPYLLIAKAKGIEVALSSVEDIPYITNCFDMVICTDVLEHVFDLNLALSKIVNVLRDGCYLVIRVPNKEDLSSYLREDYPYKYAHLRN
ncbi:MAG: cation:dicarboxylate symporter family transporter, partial [Burkholderiales bacterium]